MPPVVELQNQAGGLGTILGLAGGYFAGDAARKRSAADEKRKDQEARDYSQNIQSEMAARNATTQRAGEQDTADKLQRGLFTQYAALLQSPPKGADGKPLVGQNLKSWTDGVIRQSFMAGLTDKDSQAQLSGMAGAMVADTAPSLGQVEQGLPQLGSGATPQLTAQHYQQAAARALAAGMTDQAKVFSSMAANALKDQPKALTARDAYLEAHGSEPPSYGDLHPKAPAPIRPSWSDLYGTWKDRNPSAVRSPNDPMSVRTQLSPLGQKMFDMFASTNNPANPQQAQEAIRGASGLSMQDKVLLNSTVTKLGSGLTVPASAAGTGAKTSKDQTAAALRSSPQFSSLDGAVQAAILKDVNSGASVSGVVSDFQNNVTALAKRMSQASANPNPDKPEDAANDQRLLGQFQQAIKVLQSMPQQTSMSNGGSDGSGPFSLPGHATA
jgi:hypothetical protein